MTSIDLYDELIKVPDLKRRMHLIYNSASQETQGNRQLPRQQINFK